MPRSLDGDPTPAARNPAPEPKSAGPPETPTFEQSAARLSAIVQELESGELPLEESLRLFEEGVRAARIAQRRLDQAERRVEELLGVDERGEPELTELGS